MMSTDWWRVASCGSAASASTTNSACSDTKYDLSDFILYSANFTTLRSTIAFNAPKDRYSKMSANFTNDALGAWDFSGADQASLKAESDIYSNRLISWTARGTYAYKDRYLLTATVRFDGSSRFGADSKWGTFPSVGLAWRASEEDFLKDNKVIGIEYSNCHRYSD